MKYKFRLLIINQAQELFKQEEYIFNPLTWRDNKIFSSLVRQFNEISNTLDTDSYVTVAAFSQEELPMAVALSDDIEDYLFFINGIKSVMSQIDSSKIYIKVKKRPVVVLQ